MLRQFLWISRSPIAVGYILFGPTIVATWIIITVISIQSVFLDIVCFLAVDFNPPLHCTRLWKDLCTGINAFSSGVSEQGVFSSGPNQCELQQNPFQTTPTTAETMRYK